MSRTTTARPVHWAATARLQASVGLPVPALREMIATMRMLGKHRTV